MRVFGIFCIDVYTFWLLYVPRGTEYLLLS